MEAPYLLGAGALALLLLRKRNQRRRQFPPARLALSPPEALLGPQKVGLPVAAPPAPTTRAQAIRSLQSALRNANAFWIEQSQGSDALFPPASVRVDGIIGPRTSEAFAAVVSVEEVPRIDLPSMRSGRVSETVLAQAVRALSPGRTSAEQARIILDSLDTDAIAEAAWLLDRKAALLRAMYAPKPI